MLEHENVPGVIESLKIVTEKSTERLCRYAFDYAKAHNRKKVTLVHKAVRVQRISETDLSLFVDSYSFSEHHEGDRWTLSGGIEEGSQGISRY